MLAENHLGNNLIQGKGVRLRPGTNVGDTDHFKDAWYMGIAGLALDTVGDVENQAGPFAFEYTGHKFFETVDQIFVAFDGNDLVFTFFEGISKPFDGLHTDDFPVRHSEKIDDAA